MKASLSPKDQKTRNWSLTLLWALGLTIMLTTLLFDLHTPLGVACAVPYTVSVLLIALTKSRWGLVSAAVVASMLTLIGMKYSPQVPEIPFWQIWTNRTLALFTIWVVALTMMNWVTLEAKTKYAQTRIRILEGMLPICAACKKIRDSSNAWHGLESYITRNSEATFTHGYCPECEQRAIAEFQRGKGEHSSV